jgi:HD-GYP domain-containing protein (c-di-GMP phosphodiesterase class II)
LPIEEGLDEIKRSAGSQFDPGLAALFIKSVESDEMTPTRPAPIATGSRLAPRVETMP